MARRATGFGRLGAAAALLGVMALAAGCAVPRDDADFRAERPAIEVTHGFETVGVAIAPDSGRPGPLEERRLAAFVADTRTTADRVLLVPLTSLGENALPSVTRALVATGLPADVIREARQLPPEATAVRGDVAVAVRTLRTAVPGCPDWSRGTLIGRAHLNTSNFGCATASALATHVADPRDLAGGRTLGAADGEHAAAAARRYRDDEVKEFVELDTAAFGGSSGR